jgi:hypothetical protein
MKKATLILIITMALGLFSDNCLAVEAMEVDIHGFISQGYLDTTHNYFYGDTVGGSFDFNEFGINFANEPADNMRVGLQILARDFGSNGDDELTIDWAFGDYRFKDWLGVQAGKIKTPKGLYNETRDVDMLRTSIFLPQSVYSEILRDADLGLLGAGIYGDISLNEGGLLSYQLILGTQNIAPNESVSQAFQGTTAYRTPVENDSIDVDKKYVLGLVWETPLDGLRLGATYDNSNILAIAHATMSIPAISLNEGDAVIADFDKYQNTVFSAEYTAGGLQLVSEYIRTAKEFLITFEGVPHEQGDYSSDGWYLGATYQAAEWFHLGSYYSESYNKTDDREGNTINKPGNDIPHRGYFKDACLTTNFIINEYWNIKLEGHRFKGTYRISPKDQVPDDNGNIFAHEDWGMFAAKMTFSF